MEDMVKATGARCYFDQLITNGVMKSNYSYVNGDKIHTTIWNWILFWESFKHGEDGSLKFGDARSWSTGEMGSM